VLDTPGVPDGLIGFLVAPRLPSRRTTMCVCSMLRVTVPVSAPVPARYCAGRRYQHHRRERQADANDDGFHLTPLSEACR
jgi:hypothetical protein